MFGNPHIIPSCTAEDRSMKEVSMLGGAGVYDTGSMAMALQHNLS